MRNPFRTGSSRDSAPGSGVKVSDRIRTRFRPPLAAQEGRNERGWPDPSSMARGLAGFEAWISEEASKDAAKNIPGDDWDTVLPSLVREAQRIGSAELEAVGKTWAQRDRKLAGKLGQAIRIHETTLKRSARLCEELTGLDKQLKEYFVEAADTDTRDDDYRRHEGPFSAKTIGFWAFLGILAVGEFPLTLLAYRRLDKSFWILLSAFATGLALVGAGHFVGTKARRLVSLRERWTDYEDQTEQAFERAERIDKAGVSTNPAPMTPAFPTRRPTTSEHLRARWWLVGIVTGLALLTCGALGFLRTQQVAAEAQRAATKCDISRTAEINADEDSPRDCTKQQIVASESKSTSFLLQNTGLFTVIQILIFGVAASITYHRHDEYAEAVRTLRTKIMFVDRRVRSSARREARKGGKVDIAAAKRQGEFIARVLETKERRRAYEATIFRVQTIANRERPNGPSFEVAAQRPPLISLPAWLMASYPIPGYGTSDRYTLSAETLLPETDPDGPLLGPDLENRAGYKRSTVTPTDIGEPSTSKASDADPENIARGDLNGAGTKTPSDQATSDLGSAKQAEKGPNPKSETGSNVSLAKNLDPNLDQSFEKDRDESTSAKPDNSTDTNSGNGSGTKPTVGAQGDLKE